MWLAITRSKLSAANGIAWASLWTKRSAKGAAASFARTSLSMPDDKSVRIGCHAAGTRLRTVPHNWPVPQPSSRTRAGLPALIT